jgi:hypothetical protein
MPTPCSGWRRHVARISGSSVAGGTALAGEHLLPPTGGDWQRLAAACREHHGVEVIVDAGPTIPPIAAHRLAMRSLLVVRPCYLALRRAVQRSECASGIIVVNEPGRSLGVTDVERSLSLPILAEIPWDPAVARAVDAGLLAARLPQTLARPLRRLTTGAPA